MRSKRYVQKMRDACHDSGFDACDAGFDKCKGNRDVFGANCDAYGGGSAGYFAYAGAG